MLNVAIIGYNKEHTVSGTKAIAENDMQETIKSFCGIIEMSGGTKYVPVYTENGLKGKRFDQLIVLCDEDELDDILKRNTRLIDEILMCLSPLFSEFPCQIQCYDF